MIGTVLMPEQLPCGAAGPESLDDPEGTRMLDGARILLVEDEAMLVLEIENALEEAGADVVGPCQSLAQALRKAADEDIDAAILDVNLGGEDVFPVAEYLQRRGIPFLFHTAHGERVALRARFENAPVCRKPILVENLIAEVAELLN